MGWPAFLPKAYQINPGPPLKIGDVVTISLGARRERYLISAIHDDGTADLTKEEPV
jgi:hypothetical protein